MGSGPEADRVESAKKRPTRGPEIVYANIETGYEAISLETLVAEGLRPEAADTSDSGAFYGIGGGVRLGFLTLGARVRRANLNTADLTTIDGEVGARVSIDRAISS